VISDSFKIKGIQFEVTVLDFSTKCLRESCFRNLKPLECLVPDPIRLAKTWQYSISVRIFGTVLFATFLIRRVKHFC